MAQQPRNPMKKALADAARNDLRRQRQIDRQKAIITRLVEENQLMLDGIRAIHDPEGTAEIKSAKRFAGMLLDKIDELRAKAREEEAEHG